MIFVLQSFHNLIQNFINRGRWDRGRGRGRGVDPLGHELHVRQGGRFGQTAGTRRGLASVHVVGGLKSVVIL
jgi:hypothetical protein